MTIELTIAGIMAEVSLLAAGRGAVCVEPHEFVRLRRWRNRGRCRVCLAHEELHPAYGWFPGTLAR